MTQTTRKMNENVEEKQEILFRRSFCTVHQTFERMQCVRIVYFIKSESVFWNGCWIHVLYYFWCLRLREQRSFILRRQRQSGIAVAVELMSPTSQTNSHLFRWNSKLIGWRSGPKCTSMCNGMEGSSHFLSSTRPHSHTHSQANTQTTITNTEK